LIEREHAYESLGHLAGGRRGSWARHPVGSSQSFTSL
jgi:hypothetical protein